MLKPQVTVPCCCPGKNQNLSFVIFGASGDLAKSQIYPALWQLYLLDLLPSKLQIIAFARTRLDINRVKESCKPFMDVKPGDERKYEEFWSKNSYQIGEYDTKADLDKLNESMNAFAKARVSNRVFYIALPAVVLSKLSLRIKEDCMTEKGWNRIIIEKPYGRDLISSQILTNQLASLYSPDEVYRVDHYLTKATVDNILYIRFSNRLFSSVWNRENIASVVITSKEILGVSKHRLSYFNQNGIIRDVVQNHLIQILSLVAMECPSSLDVDDIRNEKVKVLKSTKPVVLDEALVAQYTTTPTNETFASVNQLTVTYILCIFRVSNRRWHGVPFIIECGKALDEKLTEITIQFKELTCKLFGDQPIGNKLKIRIQPNGGLKISIMTKIPGTDSDLQEIDLGFTYADKYSHKYLEGYQLVISDIINRCKKSSVRDDEIQEGWRILTPLLNQIENEKVLPVHYDIGTTGPKEREKLISYAYDNGKKINFCKNK